MFTFPIHSPVQEITYNVTSGIKLFIKRDDLIDPLISGNKWRKLKYTLADARAKQKSVLVSFGGAYSNHLLALASASAKFNFKLIAFVRGEEQRNDSEYITICKTLGAEIIKVTREEYKNKQEVFDKYFKNNEETYFIDEGGLSENGALGCEEIIEELVEDFTDIFLASGTGCTTAGIVNGIHKKELNTFVHSVIVHNGIDEVKNNISNLLVSNNNSPTTKDQRPKTKDQGPTTNYQLLDTRIFGRYAQHTDELLEFIINFQKNTGILIDPVYTGKALFKCYEWMHQSAPISSKILFIHTGGVMGNIGKLKDYSNYFQSKLG